MIGVLPSICSQYQSGDTCVVTLVKPKAHHTPSATNCADSVPLCTKYMLSCKLVKMGSPVRIEQELINRN